MANFISIDAETNGLWGSPFAVAAVVYSETGQELSRATFRCPIVGETNEWVAENVIPQMDGIAETHSSYEDMLQAIGAWWLENKADATALWHMGHVVESFLFRELVRVGSIGEWDAPYVPVEVSQVLADKGFRPDSVDSYLETKGLPKPELVGGTHNPLYDAVVAATVYFDLVK